METSRGRPPSAGKPNLFSSSGGKVITKEQKRSSSRTSILRRLSMSATNVLNGAGAGAAPTSGQAPGLGPVATTAPTAAVRADNAGRSSTQASRQQQQQQQHSTETAPTSSGGGLMSFKKHFRRSKNKPLLDTGGNKPTESSGGNGGGGPVKAPMMNAGSETSPEIGTGAANDAASDVGSDSGSESVLDPYDSAEYDTGSESFIEATQSAGDHLGSLDPTTATGSPITTTDAVSTRTPSFPKSEEHAGGKGENEKGENGPSDHSPPHKQVQPPQQQQKPPVTFVVPGPPPPVPQKVTEPANVIAPPAVPPKIPAPPPPAGALTRQMAPSQPPVQRPAEDNNIVNNTGSANNNTQISQSVQSLQAIQRQHQERQQQQQQQQQQQNAAGRVPSPTKTTKDTKEKSGGGGSLLGGLKKLRRSDSKRGNLDSVRPQQVPQATATAAPVASTPAAVVRPAMAERTASSQALDSNQTVPQAQAQPVQTTVLPPPPPPIQSPPSGSRGVDINGVPNSLRPGGGQPVQQQRQHIPQQQQQYQQQYQQPHPQQQQQPQQQQPVYDQPSQQMTIVQQQQAQHQQLQNQHQHQQQQQTPCDSCKAYYEAAWSQSEINMYALSSQLAAAHQQSAGQVALLHERDAEIAELNGLVGRLRTRIQEQVKQLEQLPTGLPGLNTMSGLNGYASGGVGQLPDGQIRSRWKGLRWQIRQCVEARLAALPPSSAASVPVSSERAPFLRRLTPDFDKFLHSRKGSVYLVEAAIWAVLSDSVFGGARRSSRMCWAARWSTSLAKMNDNMMFGRSTDPAFHQWRVQTAVFVRGLETAAEGDSQQQQQHQNQQQQVVAAPYVEAVVRQLEVEVGVLLALGTGGPSGIEDGSSGGPTGHKEPSTPSPPASSSSSSSVLRRQLYDVVAEAIGLDADLCQQRAWFYVHYPTSTSGQHYGMPFDAREMESVTVTSETASQSSGGGSSETHLSLAMSGVNSSSSNVDSVGNSSNGQHGSDDVSLVVRPALFKAGNSRGEAYDQTSTIEPSIVCQTTPTGRGFRRWAAGGRRDRSRSRG